jgi:hypothetical protein
MKKPHTRRTTIAIDLAKFAAGLTASFGILLGAFSLADRVGLDVPRWAWAEELNDTNENLDDLSKDVLKLELDSKQLQYYQNQRDIADYQQQGLVPPPFLVDEQRKLELVIEILAKKVE